MSVETDGKKKIVKSYATSLQQNVNSYIRERDALLALKSTGLCPRLESFSDKGQFLISQHIDGFTMRDFIRPEYLATVCRTLGQWIGRFSKRAPHQKARGNWFDYLQNYPPLQASGALLDGRDFLETFQFNRLVLAKNDGALSNFIVSKNGQISGLDFEHAQFKPIGWDLLLTARSLARLYPAEVEVISTELAEGFCDTAQGQPEAYVSLIRLFIIASVFESDTQNAITPAMLALQTFNVTSITKAELVAAATGQEANLQELDPEMLSGFKSHLTKLVQDIAKGQDVRDCCVENNDTEPKLELQALCRACQGGCCAIAVGKNAFIDLATIEKFHLSVPDRTSNEVLNLYIDLVPPRHVSGSCFYHGLQGCELPRNMRSETCNGFMCHSAKSLMQRVKNHAPESILCVAGEGQNITRATRTLAGQIKEVPLNLIGLPNKDVAHPHQPETTLRSD